MGGIDLLHFTDYHGNSDKIAVISKLLQERKIDAILHTGDFLDFNPGNEESTGRKLLTTHAILFPEWHRKGEEIREFQEREWKNLNKKDQRALAELEELVNEQAQFFTNKPKEQASYKARAEEIIGDSTKTVVADFSELAQHASIYGVLGNHDLTSLYDLLSDHVTFVERFSSAKISNDEGLELVVKGELNTWEQPIIFGLPGTEEVIKDLTIPYESGLPLKEVGEEELKEAVRKYQEAQRERLGSPDEKFDIYLAHKTPTNGSLPAIETYGHVTGDLAVEYSKNAALVCGGHFHGAKRGQVGNHALIKILNSIKTGNHQTETIDEEEVPVIYLDASELREFNPGTEHFFVYHFNGQKELDYIDIYQFE